MEENAVALLPTSGRITIASFQRHSFPSNHAASTLANHVDSSQQGEPDDFIILREIRKKNESFALETFSVILSMLYCLFLVVLGFSLPVVRVVSSAMPSYFYNMFYIYLYGGSLILIIMVNLVSMKKIAVFQLKCKKKSSSVRPKNKNEDTSNYGSVYLRLGACGFGVGAMVYSGLEFGEHFVHNDLECEVNILSIIKPALRMIFTLFQIQFIFLSATDIRKVRCKSLMRLCFAHMLATDLAEWLGVLVEETKHEIHNIYHQKNNTIGHTEEGNVTGLKECNFSNNGMLLTNATSYLFPCTVEYSLICAVTLVEMWKDVAIKDKEDSETFLKETFRNDRDESKQEYSMDCSHSELGVVGGLVAQVYTIISLVVFFTLHQSRPTQAYWCLTLCEALLNTTSILAILAAAYQMRRLAYCVHRFNEKGSLRLGLDLSLLLKAQFGTYLYNVFSGLACYLAQDSGVYQPPVWPEIFAILQTSAQTIFIVDSWWKRCLREPDQARKPGRQCLTFLRMANMCLWIITITEKNRAQLRPLQYQFYGLWPWALIVHATVPLQVFYRFHSMICLFELWRNTYKGVHVAPDTQLIL